MGTVRSLKPAQGLEEFCNFLWGEQEGFVHLPIKDPETGKYTYNYFFKWPHQRQEVIDHVIRHCEQSEVFIAPGMFRKRSANVIDALGSYVAWADFDGNVPSLDELEELDIPLPTLRVQSSEPGHEHWYWRYDQFNTDIVSVQGINRAIAYALQGDIGAWDAGHSLRPLGTYNHKRGGLPVVIISHNDYTYKPASFAQVPLPQNSYTLEQFQREQIPNPVKTLMKHGPWPDDAVDLLTKYKIPEGSRSSALTRVAYTCAEQGLDNSEIYSLIAWADKRWRKFADRDNKEKYYVDLVNYARQKIPYEGIKDVVVNADELKTYSFLEVLEFVDETEWVLDGLLPKKGIGYVVGRPGTGKTTLALDICTHLALAKPFLWEATDKRLKVLYLSLEMTLEDVNDFYSKIKKNFTDEELATLDKNFHTYASSEKVKFYSPGSPIMGKFLRTLENLKPDVLLIDSASYSLAANLSNQDEVTKSIELIDMIKEKYGVTLIFIHHSRKEPPGHGYKEADLDDVFGSAFIAASASWIVSLKQAKDFTPEKPLMDLRHLKARFSGNNMGFSVVMDGATRMFRRPSIGALPVAEKKKEETPKKQRSFFDI